MFKLEIDNSQIYALEKKVKDLGKKAFPSACRFALNRVARQVQNDAKEKIKKDFIIRNKHTERGIWEVDARGSNINAMRSTVGSIDPYMEKQEFGGRVKAKGRHGLAIPTPVAAGMKPRQYPRTKMIRRKMHLSNLSLYKGKVSAYRHPTGGTYSARQEVYMRAILAIDSGKGYVAIERNDKWAIYKVTGGKKLKSGRRTKIHMRTVYDISRRSVQVEGDKWLSYSVDRIVDSGTAAKFAIEALKSQLNRETWEIKGSKGKSFIPGRS